MQNLQQATGSRRCYDRCPPSAPPARSRAPAASPIRVRPPAKAPAPRRRCHRVPERMPRVRPTGRLGRQPAQGVHPPRRLAPLRASAAACRRCTTSASRSPAASASRSSGRTARASRRSSGCSRRCCCTTAAAPRCSGSTCSQSRGPSSAWSTGCRSRRRSSSACRRSRTSATPPGSTGMGPRQTRERIPRDPAAWSASRAERRDEPMEDLSRGMQQKIALARALLTSPVLLLLDEPTTGLDPRSKLEVQAFIRTMRERARLHDPALHARHGRGRGAGRPGRDPPPRRAAVPGRRPTRSSACTAPTRWSRHS